MKANVQQLLMDKPVEIPWRERTELSQFRISGCIFTLSTAFSQNSLGWGFPPTLIQYLKLNWHQTWTSIRRSLVLTQMWPPSIYVLMEIYFPLHVLTNPTSLLFHDPGQYGKRVEFYFHINRCMFAFRSLCRNCLTGLLSEWWGVPCPSSRVQRGIPTETKGYLKGPIIVHTLITFNEY